jgi:signal transduction histidine kinase/serine phosphatase RsbU (regulator of sigma subunit)
LSRVHAADSGAGHGATPRVLRVNDFLAGGGEMGARVRAYDWAATPLGPTGGWPQSLRTAVSLCLSSRFPIIVWWGPEMVMIYNDAYIPIPGAKHPHLLGQRGREGWAEIWDIIGPMLSGVLERGEATWSEDQMLPLRRRGFTEECYFTFSYSPIRGESGAVEGIFTAVTETTDRMLGERRLRMLKNLGERVTGAQTVEAACEIAAATLAEDRADLPFALLYLRTSGQQNERLKLCASVGVEAGGAAAPMTAAGAADGWPLADVLRTGVMRSVDHLSARFGPLPGGPWPEPAREALVLPLAAPGAERQPARSFGVLVVGVSPRRALDEDYSDFLRLVAGQVATGIASARAYEEETKRAEALAELDRAKTTFFSNISHEFRTPLTLLLGPVEDALAAPGQGLAGEGLLAVHRNGLRLLKLVNTLLDFSRLEAGRMQAVFEPTDLSVHTAELASAFHSAIKRAGLKFFVDCPPLPALVLVDREMWEKVVLNLLSNALKFTRKGEIEVRVRAVDGAAEVTVRDTGTGIPADELPRVFERFHRVEGVEGRTHEGTGIGLALVQELVKLHGGSVRVESVYGHGSAFTVSLPFGEAPLPPEQRPAARTRESSALRPDAFVEEALRWLPEESEEREADRGAPASEPIRVLVADDNADMRAYLCRLLTARGWTVTAVADGVAALAAARKAPHDLVLTDVMMPRMDGIALVKELRADARTAPLPVVLLSARAGEESRVEGLETGADDYLIKPFSSRELLARVSAHLEVARLRREAERRQARIAETLQRSLLMTPPDGAFPGLDIATAYEPASNEMELGGDFYDAFALHGGRVALVVGDVTGKGLVAASYTAEVKFALRAFLREDPTPATALTRLNRFLCEGRQLDARGDGEPAYVALLLAVIDAATGEVVMSAGGAEPPLLLSARTGATVDVEVLGLLLGADDTAQYDALLLTLAPGDVLILATDGISEARRSRAFFGSEGIARTAEAQHAAGTKTASGFGQAILAEAHAFAGGPLRDDACLLVARRLP